MARWQGDFSGEMGTKGTSWVTVVLGLSRSILHDRKIRRTFIIYVIGVLVALFALGAWPLAAWLEDSLIRFVFWWGGCGLLAVFLFLMGLYDFLRVLRENDSNG